jgi:HTH-type transcriptional regulator/antitoxin HigA
MPLTYKVIKSDKQYNKYCQECWDISILKKQTKEQKDIAELLWVLIEKYDNEHIGFKERELSPIEFLTSIMEDHKMRSIDLANLLAISKGHASDILNYRRALTKEMIRKLADRFKVLQEAFNQPYELKKPSTRKTKKRKLPKAA